MIRVKIQVGEKGRRVGGWEYTSVVKRLLRTCEALDSSLAWGSEVEGHHRLHNKFKAILPYTKHWSPKKSGRTQRFLELAYSADYMASSRGGEK